jgi:hypothetical protein
LHAEPRGTAGTVSKGDSVKNIKEAAGLLLGALILFATSANATTIRSVSNYGAPIAYTSSSGLDTLTSGTLFVDPSNPVDGGAFNEEVLCPFSVGCSDPGSEDFELLIESLSALTPGTQITVNLGPSVSLGTSSLFPGVALLTCFSSVSGEYCMTETPSAACFTDGTSTDGSGNNLVTIGLSTDPSCAAVPSTLVFSLDELGDSPTFAGISTNSGGNTTVPEPGSLVLLSVGLLSTAILLSRWRRGAQGLQSGSKV